MRKTWSTSRITAIPAFSQMTWSLMPAGQAELPEKPVMITFDDGYYNNLIYVLPLLKKYDMKAVISIVGSFTERAQELNDQNPAYAHMIWADIKALAASGYVEIGSHSYALHSVDKGREGGTAQDVGSVCGIREGFDGGHQQAKNGAF